MDEFDELVASIGPRRVACVLTPVASGEALAGLAALSDVRTCVLGTATGAAVVASLTGEVDPFAALTGAAPEEAAELARSLARLIHAEVVLVVSTLTPGEGGSMEAWRFGESEPEQAVAPGLVVAALDSQVEDFLIGEIGIDDLDVIDTASLPRWKATRMFARGLKRRKK
ncbi:MAG: hypothetical protein L0G23_04450 [Ruaniaceae bacterium]|nr:hypothetical protein [Ruaniaceae bacterium]